MTIKWTQSFCAAVVLFSLFALMMWGMASVGVFVHWAERPPTMLFWMVPLTIVTVMVFFSVMAIRIGPDPEISIDQPDQLEFGAGSAAPVLPAEERQKWLNALWIAVAVANLLPILMYFWGTLFPYSFSK